MSGDWLALAAVAGLAAAGEARNRGSPARPHSAEDLVAVKRKYRGLLCDIEKHARTFDDPVTRQAISRVNRRHASEGYRDQLEQRWEARINRVVMQINRGHGPPRWRQRVLDQRYVYHFTAYDRLPSIRRRGLVHEDSPCLFVTTYGGAAMWAGYASDKRGHQVGEQHDLGIEWRWDERVKMRSAPIVFRASAGSLDPGLMTLDKVGTVDALFRLERGPYDSVNPEDLFAICYGGALPASDLEWARVRRKTRTHRGKAVGYYMVTGPWTKLVRGARNDSAIDFEAVNLALALVPELRAKMKGEQTGPEWVEPHELLGGFYLSDYPGLSKSVRVWWKAQTGLTYIGQGTSRVVFRLPNGQVIKFALDYDGERSNRSEIDAWGELGADPEVADYLVPLLAGDERYVVMAFAEPIRRGDIPAVRQRETAWTELLWEDRAGAVDDLTLQNWGRHQGKIRLLDYEQSS